METSAMGMTHQALSTISSNFYHVICQVLQQISSTYPAPHQYPIYPMSDTRPVSHAFQLYLLRGIRYKRRSPQNYGTAEVSSTLPELQNVQENRVTIRSTSSGKFSRWSRIQPTLCCSRRNNRPFSPLFPVAVSNIVSSLLSHIIPPWCNPIMLDLGRDGLVTLNTAATESDRFGNI